MKSLEQLRKLQDKLDAQTVKCPHCGKECNWGFVEEWGSCGDCVADEMKKDDNERFKDAFEEEKPDPLAEEFVPPHWEPEN